MDGNKDIMDNTGFYILILVLVILAYIFIFV